ncbi:MAG: nucleotidyltransferase family protein [Pyrinomonadaceae bacterium]
MNLALAEKEKIVEICERNDIEFCALFGSFARSEADEESDIDLLVRFSKPKGIDWLDAAFEIEDTLGRKVDLVTEKSLHPLIRESVFENLQIFYGERKRDSTEAHP